MKTKCRAKEPKCDSDTIGFESNWYVTPWGNFLEVARNPYRYRVPTYDYQIIMESLGEPCPSVSLRSVNYVTVLRSTIVYWVHRWHSRQAGQPEDLF